MRPAPVDLLEAWTATTATTRIGAEFPAPEKQREKMALPVLVKQLVDLKVGRYCKRKVPPHARNRVKVDYSVRGNHVTLFEWRAPFLPEEEEWVKVNVAQLRFDPPSRTWTLHWRDRNRRWHPYEHFRPSKSIDAALAEIERDPSAIFWG